MEFSNSELQDKKNKKIAMQVSLVSIIINVALASFKLLAGIIANSGAMISDAVHSASDVFSTLIAVVGIQIASRKTDVGHPYGHERFECVASIILSVVLAIVGVGIGWQGLKQIFGINEASAAIPGALALIAAVVSIVVKEAMYWYTWVNAKRIGSIALKAEAWHHRSDAFSSVGALIGIAGARMGAPILDPIASLVICVFIGKAALDIFRSAIDRMVDHSCDLATEGRMREIVLGCRGVMGIDVMNTRLFGSKIYVDIEIEADGELPLRVAHGIAESVHHAIEDNFPTVKHCMVHVNPVKPQEMQ